MRKRISIAAVFGAVFCLLFALAAAEESTPSPTTATYRLPIFFARELPPRCREHAVKRRHDFAMADLSAGEGYDIVFVGDSLIESWAPLPLSREHRVANRGIACDTTNGLHERLNRDVIAHQPKLVVVLAGVNDLYLLTELTPWDRAKHVTVNLASLAIRLQGHGIRPVFLSVLPVRIAFPGLSVGRTNELIRDTNTDVQRHLRQINATFLQLNPSLRDAQRQLQERFTADGLHLNSEGYKYLAKRITPKLESMLR